MDLHRKEKEQKRAMALIRERDALYKHKYSIAPIKLDKQIHHGFVRSLELRADVRQRSDYAKIAEAIKFIGQWKAYHPDMSFIKHNGKYTSEKHAHLKSICDPCFRFYYTEAKRTADIEQIKSFEKYLWYHSNAYTCSCHDERIVNLTNVKSFRPHYYFKYPWMLNEVTKPHYLTHYTPVYGELEGRLHEINAELYNNHYFERYINNRSGGDKRDIVDTLSIKYDDKKSVIYHALKEEDVILQ